MAATDLLTLGEARAALNVKDQQRDVEIAVYVSAVSQRIDALCGPVVNRTITAELHDGGSFRIFPEYTPVSSVSALTEYAHTTGTALTAESNSTKPASGYMLDSRGNVSYIWRRSGGGMCRFPEGIRNVSVTYVAGRAASTAAVDAKFKLAAQAILRRLWKREQSAWAQGPARPIDSVEQQSQSGFYKAVDPMVRELLADELLPVGVA